MTARRAAVTLALAALACHRPAPEAGPPEGETVLPRAALQRGARVVEVREQDLAQEIVAPGRVSFDDQRVAHVFAPVPGRVTRVLAGLGQRVAKGDALAVLRSPDAATAFSDVAKADADLAQASAELARQRKLVAAEAAPQRDLVAAEDTHRRAEAELARARQRAVLLRPGSAEDVTQEFVLRSPIAGEVMARAVSPGMELQGASAGTPLELFTVGDIATVWVLADVSDTDLPHVRPGAEATVRVPAWPGRSFRGTVTLVGATLDPATRTGRVRISLANPDRALKPEGLVQASLAAAPRRALVVPREAIARIEGQAFVNVAAGETPDGKLRFHRQRIAADDGAPLATVTAGLQPGDHVLVEEPATKVIGGEDARISDRQLRAAGIEVAPAAELAVPEELGVGGRIAFDDLRVAHVFSPVTGRVARVLAAPGDQVKAGAPLLTMVSPEVGTAFADQVKAEADLVAARHERDRQRDLVQAHAGAPRDLEAAEAAFRKASAEAGRARAKAQLLRAGSFDAVTQEYTLRSPVEGVVVSRLASPGLEVQGQWSGAGNPVELFTVGALDPLWVIGDVYEMDLPQVRPGQAVVVRVPSVPGRSFGGRIDWVSDVLDPVTRTAKVRCAIENHDRLLRPEMAPVLSVTLPGHHHLAVPRRAVLRLGDETVVFVAAGRTPEGLTLFKRRRVVVGDDRASGLVPILEGLAPGESIAVKNAIFLVGLL